MRTPPPAAVPVGEPAPSAGDPPGADEAAAAGRSVPPSDAAATPTSAGTVRKAAKKATRKAVKKAAPEVAGKVTDAISAGSSPAQPPESTPKQAPAKKTTAPRKTAAAKKAPAARRTTAAGAPGRQNATPGTAVPDDGVASGATTASGRTAESRPRPSAARWILDHPGYAPELLALAAVQVLGPEAAAWAARLRATYPAATPAGLARLATRRYVRFSTVGAALSVGTGVLAPVAELVTLVWSQTELVLRLAAAYGHDPTGPDRAADLLVLTRIHPDRPSARAALADAERVVNHAGAGPDSEPADRITQAAWRLGAPTLARSTGWLAMRLVTRRLPGATALAAGLAGATATERLAARATTLYRTAVPGQSQSNHSRGSSA